VEEDDDLPRYKQVVVTAHDKLLEESKTESSLEAVKT